tara:strand:+ start:51705 stop:52250 length:546 start_codon:yes stop_codon:yes gene_type:complete
LLRRNESFPDPGADGIVSPPDAHSKTRGDKEAAMADQPDLDQLAKQYLDLWQDHMQSMAADPKVTETMSQMTQMMTGSATAFAALAQQAINAGKQPPTPSTSGPSTEPPTHEPSDDGPGATTPAPDGPGTPAPGAAHGGADLDMAELARRLDGIERRLAALESGTGGARKGPGKGPSKRSA